MKIKNHCEFIIILLSILLCGCEYHNDEVYFREINQNVALPDLIVDLNLTTDTIYVYGSPQVKLSMKLTNKTLYSVKFYVNSMEVKDLYSIEGERYSFTINMHEPSQVTVSAEIIMSSETGSIADKLHAESFIYKTKEWVLIYTSEKLNLKYEVVDGRLKYSWTPIKSSTAGKYYLWDTHKTDSTYNTWFIDSAYFGGSKYVYLYYEDNGISGYAKAIEFNFPHPKAYVNNKDSFLICWEKSKFYNNIKGFQINIGDSSYYKEPTDTCFVFKGGVFGRTSYGTISYIYKDPASGNNLFYAFANVMANYQLSFLPDYTFLENLYFPLQGPTFYFFKDEDGVRFLKTFSSDSKSTEFYLNITYDRFIVSPNNRYVLGEINGVWELRNGNTLMYVNNYLVSLITAGHSITDLIISDKGTIAFYDISKDCLKVYNLITDSPIVEIPVSGYYFNYKISADGKYLFEQQTNSLFKIDIGKFTNIWSNPEISKQFKFFEFYPDSPNTIAVYDGETFSIKKCSDFSTQTSFTLNNTTVHNIDFVNKKILCSKNYIFYIHSLIDGELLQTVPSNTTNGGRIFNNFIFCDVYQFQLED